MHHVLNVLSTLVVLVLLVVTTAGCASADHVLFVTKTSIGVDFDSKPATASLGYDRVEGYVAPRYANGEIPPVVASVKSDGGIFNPNIKQVYATGDAATIATGGPRRKRYPPLEGDGTLMFFGTTTTTGLKVGFTTTLPDSFVFGFKRKEYSYIPMATVKDEKDDKKPGRHVYPSVLASIDTAANVSAEGVVVKTALSNSQFFATGAAARNLAAMPSIQEAFISIAADSVKKQQKENVDAAQYDADVIGGLLDAILTDFADEKTKLTQKQAIVDAAKAGGIDAAGNLTVDNFDKKLSEYSSTKPPADVKKKLHTLRDKVDALLNP